MCVIREVVCVTKKMCSVLNPIVNIFGLRIGLHNCITIAPRVGNSIKIISDISNINRTTGSCQFEIIFMVTIVPVTAIANIYINRKNFRKNFEPLRVLGTEVL